MINLSNYFEGWAANFLSTTGISLITVWIFLRFSFKNWVSHHFQEALEKFRHSQNLEVERLRFSISSMTDRAIKFHGHEFEVLPTLWEDLSNAHRCVSELVASFQFFPDLERMGSSQFEDFIEAAPLRDWQKTELKKSSDKNQYYQSAITAYRTQESMDSFNKFYKKLALSALFLDKNIDCKCNEIASKFRYLLNDFNIRMNNPSIHTNYDKVNDAIETSNLLLGEIREAIRLRLSTGIPLSIIESDGNDR